VSICQSLISKLKLKTNTIVKRIYKHALTIRPVNITFHDDNASIVTQLWTAYYNYYYADGTFGSRDGAGAPNQSARPYDRFNTHTKVVHR
jgi:hypothetical protein